MELYKENESYKYLWETLEDLYLLGDQNLYPLFNNLHFYLNELKFHNFFQKRNQFSNLETLLKEKINNEVKDIFRNAKAGAKIDIVDNLVSPDLEELDIILKTIPVAKKLISKFNLKSRVKIFLANEYLTFEGRLPKDKDLEKLRDISYQITRELFQNKVLLTFDLLEINSKDCFTISFKFSFSKKKSTFYLPVDEEKVLVLPSLLKNFQIDPSKVKQIGQNSIYRLKKNFNLEKYSSIHDVDSIRRNESIVLHFSFLFRPISLIIDGDDSCKLDDHLKSDNKTDVTVNKLFFEVDIFSLLQK